MSPPIDAPAITPLDILFPSCGAAEDVATGVDVPDGITDVATGDLLDFEGSGVDVEEIVDVEVGLDPSSLSAQC
jgi:hypothetical protein